MIPRGKSPSVTGVGEESEAQTPHPPGLASSHCIPGSTDSSETEDPVVGLRHQ